MRKGFLLQSEHKIEIDINPDGEMGEMAALAAGITEMDPNVEDELSQDRYYDGGGFGETDVTGSQLIITFGGHRKYGDPAQDYIFSTLLETGGGRRTNLEWTLPNGDIYKGNVTIAEISGPGGEAGEKGEIEFELHFNSKPEFTQSA